MTRTPDPTNLPLSIVRRHLPELPEWLRRWARSVQPRTPDKVFVRRLGGVASPWWWFCLRCGETEQFLDHRSALHHAVGHAEACIMPAWLARYGLEYHPL